MDAPDIPDSRSDIPDSRYWTGAHTKHCLRYHLVWIPKYRQRLLTGVIAHRLQELLHHASAVNRWRIHELAIQSDHVHLLLQIHASDRISDVMQR
ncbi:MAG: IS200/IS605 family transposase [Capsulimonas sp.]|uniref:IS200/IS605 family transposase n=1 Tax=Capsulimonas sp. TaxID=2494211 RepID=UPI0032644D45